MAERVAVVGACAHPNLDVVRAFVRTLPAGTVVVSGGAAGVDRVARETALACEFTVVEYVPIEGAHDQSFIDRVTSTPWDDRPQRERIEVGCDLAPRDVKLFRNTWVAVTCTRMAMFPDGSRGGSWDAAREAVRFRRPVTLHWADGRVVPYTDTRQQALF